MIAHLPDDPALPGLVAIRTHGLAAALPALGPVAPSAELRLCGYHPGARATIEVRDTGQGREGGRHCAVKAYAGDAEPEADLYRALAAAGVGGDAGPRVPQLITWDRELRVVVLSWLDGPSARTLVKQGEGKRAGELAASWLAAVATAPTNVGILTGSGLRLVHAGKAVAALKGADSQLGVAAAALASQLTQTQPREAEPHLVHGTLYDRHIIDTGDGPGVIDWQRFGLGPLELDAGMFLASLSRLRLLDPSLAAPVADAEAAFLARAGHLLEERALAWHRAAALLRLAQRPAIHRKREEWTTEANALLAEAARFVPPPAGHVSVRSIAAPAFRLRFPSLALVLQALSTRPATPEELDEIRRLLERDPPA